GLYPSSPTGSALFSTSPIRRDAWGVPALALLSSCRPTFRQHSFHRPVFQRRRFPTSGCPRPGPLAGHWRGAQPLSAAASALGAELFALARRPAVVALLPLLRNPTCRGRTVLPTPTRRPGYASLAENAPLQAENWGRMPRLMEV